MICALALGAAIAVTQFPASGNDDTHITYWAAHALARYGRIVNYNGVAIEQSSSLALVLLLAIVERVAGVAPPFSAPFISIFAAVATVALTAVLGRRSGPVAGAVAPLLTATALPVLYWSTSGMETTLAAALGLAVIATAGSFIDGRGRLPTAGAAMAAFALVRPESPFVLLCALCAGAAFSAILWLQKRDRAALGRALEVLVIGALLVAALAAWRHHAFGTFVPNPAAQKTGGFAIRSGARYLWDSAVAMGPLFLVAAGAGLAFVTARAIVRGGDASTALTIGFAAASVAFVIGSGGDWMPAGRFLVPAIPPFALLAARAIAALYERRHVAARVAALVATAAVVVLDIRGAWRSGDSPHNASIRDKSARGVPDGLSPDSPHYAFSELANLGHRRDVLLLDKLLPIVRQFKPTPAHPLIVMSGQAGMVPYYLGLEWYGAFRFQDLFSLSDTSLIPCMPPERRSSEVLGVRMDTEYLLKNAATLGTSCGFHRPHVIFSTGNFPAYLDHHGYKSIYKGPDGIGGYIAVDSGLAKRLSL